MKLSYRFGGVLLLTSLFGLSSAQAEESLFGYIYTTDLLPAGAKEVEQWMTWRHGKTQGEFDVWEGRTAIEYGVTDRFQVALYADYVKTRAYHDGIDGSTFAPESFADYQYGPDDHFNHTRFQGFSFEAIYRILSPYEDPIGLAVYIEPTFGKGLRELESRIILQKNFFDDRLVIAANATVEQEMRLMHADPTAAPGSDEAEGHWDKETDVNFSVGASYRFMPKWSAGFEIEHEREYAGFNVEAHNRTNVGTYVGPNIHYGGEKFFITATYLTQIGGGIDFANFGADSFVVGGRNYADDFEKERLRVKAGFYF